MNKNIITLTLIILIFSSCAQKNEKYIEDFKDRFYMTQNKSFGLSLTTRSHWLYNIDDEGKKHFILKDKRKTFPKIEYSYYGSDLNAYYYNYNTFIYRFLNEKEFRILKIGSKTDLVKYSFVTPLLKEMISGNKIVNYLYASHILAKNRDAFAVNKIKEYAKGNFSEEQILSNSRMTLDRIEKVSIDVLKKYNIP